MGKIKSTGGGNTSYLSIIDGYFREKSDKNNPAAEPRVNKNNETIYEVLYEAYSGFIRNIEFKKHDQYGWRVLITIEDKDEKAVIQIPRDSDYFRDFAMRLMSVEPKTLLRPCAIKVFASQRKDSDYKNGFMIPLFYEDGEYKQVARKYNQQNPGNLPEWEQVPDPKSGDLIWSKLKQNKFLTEGVYSLWSMAKEYLPAAVTEEVPDYGIPASESDVVDKSTGQGIYSADTKKDTDALDAIDALDNIEDDKVGPGPGLAADPNDDDDLPF